MGIEYKEVFTLKSVKKPCCVVVYLDTDDNIICYHLSHKETDKFGASAKQLKGNEYSKAFILDDVECSLVLKKKEGGRAFELLWYKADTYDLLEKLDVEYYNYIKKGNDFCDRYDPVSSSIAERDRNCYSCSLWEICNEGSMGSW